MCNLGTLILWNFFWSLPVVYCTVSFYKMKTTKAHVLCNIIINFQNQKSLFFLSCWGDIYLCLSARLCEKQQYFGMSTMFGGFFLNQRFTREAPMCWHQNMATWSFSLWLSRLGLCFFVFLNVFFTLGNQPEFLFYFLMEFT